MGSWEDAQLGQLTPVDQRILHSLGYHALSSSELRSFLTFSLSHVGAELGLHSKPAGSLGLYRDIRGQWYPYN